MPSAHSVKARTAPSKAPVIKSLLISLLRQPGHIIALLADDIDGVLQPGLRQVNLAELDTRLFAQAASLLADWHSLQKAIDLASVWPAFWRVFWMSLPDPGNSTTPVMPQVAAIKKPVATAAHPRAFRGTKYQPPKAASPALDLCTWLADQRLLDAFFARHDFAALPALDAQGQLIVLAADALPPTTASLFFRHWQTTAQALPVFPDGFRRCFLWQLRACSAEQQLAWLQIWRRHCGMQVDDACRSENLGLLAHLCALSPAQSHAAELAQLLPAIRQNIFLHVLMRELQGQLSDQQMSVEQLMRLHGLSADDVRFEFYLRNILRNLGRQVSVEYSLIGCLLYESSDIGELRDYVLTAKHDCQDVPVEAIVRACDAAGIKSWVFLWDYCAELPGLAQLLRETRWEKFSQQAAETWLNIFYKFIDEDEKEKLQAKWQVYLKLFSFCHDVLINLTAERQDKLARIWSWFVGGWSNALTLPKAVHDFLPLMHRLCLPPFSIEIDYGHSLVNIIETWPEDKRHEILALDDRVWRQFERACRREDNVNLLTYGIYSLANATPSLLRTSFLATPARFFKTACLLGSLHFERRQLFMRRQLNTEWFTLDWQSMPPQTACQRLLELCEASGLDSPLPRRLREYLAGDLNLSPQQIARHCKLSLSRLPALRLRAIEAALWIEMDGSFQLRDASASARHALRLLAGMNHFSGRNRQSLRRFLINARNGDTLAYIQHPLNRAWYAKHPGVQQAIWQTGLLRKVQIGQAELTLAFEHDPFEVLMMGSYAGTCLGIGGLCDYSTVACLLDANKQVLYARDAEGRVVARQLLAIDEADQLVCFWVYPQKISQELKAAFKSYDIELAALLGLPMYQDSDDSSYDVTTILAQGWWDDGPWLEE
ncbi:hypothetical protein ACO0LF_18545 [Undibacterium sp. Di27W]|uniref:hypothetical protein n=1 Tax=Undibacterium sp. Di27W TaxID=3413036 RepID=UPI003BF2A499